MRLSSPAMARGRSTVDHRRVMNHRAPAFHPATCRRLCEMLLREDGASEALRANAASLAARLAASEDFVDFETVRGVIQAARQVHRRPTLALDLGQRMPLEALGCVGAVAATSADLADALRAGTRFSGLLCAAVKVRLDVQRSGAWLVVDEHLDLGDVRDFILDHTLAVVANLVSTVARRDLAGAEIWLPRPQPRWHAAYQAFGAEVRHGAAFLAVRFPRPLLDAPCVAADATARAAAWADCERAERGLRQRQSLTGRVVRLLDATDDLRLTLDDIALHLGVSRQAAQSGLRSEGASLAALRDEALRRRALAMLRDPALPIDRIAERLGYGGATSFSTMFRKWFGVLPRALRDGSVAWPELEA